MRKGMERCLLRNAWMDALRAEATTPVGAAMVGTVHLLGAAASIETVASDYHNADHFQRLAVGLPSVMVYSHPTFFPRPAE